ncbi:MAG: fumarylacetoacetate hydrolase family protein [Desulfovermiculus sp.]|nr:fumarylacetoacetate hydrolase family protein [Desulfovermiculus sp.]
MFITRVAFQGRPFWARCEENEVLLLGWNLEQVAQVSRQDVHPLPLLSPGKVVCVGMNYYAHAREMDKAVPEEPLLFLKPGSAVIDHGQPIRLPTQSAEVHYEGELAVVMKSLCCKVSEAEAIRHVLGYTCANDVTARDLQTKDIQYTRAKGFDTFCPLGPGIETGVQALREARISTWVNDESVQSGLVSDMIVSPLALVAFISKVMTLHPGDVILTGTPPGVGTLNPGDQVCVDIEGIGRLCNPVQ